MFAGKYSTSGSSLAGYLDFARYNVDLRSKCHRLDLKTRCSTETAPEAVKSRWTLQVPLMAQSTTSEAMLNQNYGGGCEKFRWTVSSTNTSADYAEGLCSVRLRRRLLLSWTSPEASCSTRLHQRLHAQPELRCSCWNVVMFMRGEHSDVAEWACGMRTWGWGHENVYPVRMCTPRILCI